MHIDLSFKTILEEIGLILNFWPDMPPAKVKEYDESSGSGSGSD